MKKVIFVDDEPLVLQGVKRSLRSKRHEWEMVFEEDPENAVVLLTQQPFDVVVSDMRMPKLSGVDVLEAAREYCPHAVRIGLSGFASSELSFEAARVAHQYFAKPCDVEELTTTIDSVIRLQEKVRNPDLLRSMQSITSLPAVPSLYDEVTREAAAEEGSLERVGEIIAQDSGMTTKILQLVNTAHFGIGHEINSPGHAVSVLGFETVRTLILQVHLFSTLKDESDQARLNRLRVHGANVSKNAAEIARALGLNKTGIEQSRLAGMLHDLGQLVILSEMPRAHQIIRTIVTTGLKTRVEAENEILGCDHLDIAAYILTLWGFNHPVIEAVAYHHTPSLSGNQSISPLTAVHLANVIQTADADASDRIDEDYIRSLGLTCDSIGAAADTPVIQQLFESMAG